MAYGTSIKPLVFFFSQNYTDEQISQRRTETLSQPISQSLSANVKGSGPSPNPSPAGKGRSMWGYPYRAADKRIERSVHPLHRGISVITPLSFGGGVGGGAALSHVLLFFSQNYTEGQNTQGFTETLSQPRTQSVSANIKGSGPSPNPSPAGKGRSMWGYPYRAADKRIERSVHPLHRGISVITPLPFGGGVGGGAALSHVLLYSLTEPHRRTEITKAHRDVKSTDITERYNQN